MSRYRSTLLYSSYSTIYYYNSLLIGYSNTNRGILGPRSRLIVRVHLVIATKLPKLDYLDKENVISINIIYLHNSTNFLLFSIIYNS